MFRYLMSGFFFILFIFVLITDWISINLRRFNKKRGESTNEFCGQTEHNSIWQIKRII
jgi:heme/copper-type cytochrome/quinol oxidase subunit 2